MKRSIAFLALLCIALSSSAQIGIGTNTPNSSAMLDINSTTKGALMPRMTSAQRNAIISPATGLLVYDTDTKSFWMYNGTIWSNIVSSGTFSLPFSASVNMSGAVFSIENQGGDAIRGISSNFGVIGMGSTGVYAEGTDIGLFATSSSGKGLEAHSYAGIALYAYSNDNYGMYANSGTKSAIIVNQNNTNPGISITNQGPFGTAIDALSYHADGVVGGTNSSGRAGIFGSGNVENSKGVWGQTTHESSTGVYGSNPEGIGVYGHSANGVALKGTSFSGLALEVNGNLKITGGNTSPSNGAVLTSDATGKAVWKNNRIAFSTYGIHSIWSNISTNASTKVHFEVESYDLDGNYNLFNGVGSPPATASTFEVPRDGIYHVDVSTVLSSTAIFSYGYIRLMVKRVASQWENTLQHMSLNGTTAIGRLSRDIHLQEGDLIWVEVEHDNPTNTPALLNQGNSISYFNVHLVMQN